MKEKIYSHASIAIVASKRSEEFLFDQYTDTYVIVDWRRRINLIGGNQSLEDYSPRGIWEREILEEFCSPSLPESADIPEVPLSERVLIAKSMLDNARPYKDFLVKIPEIIEFRDGKLQNRGPIVKLNTVFETFLDEDIFECVRGHLKAGRRIKNEGGSILKHIDDLIDGKTLSASATGLIMEEYLHDRHVKMPNPERVTAVCLGTPRDTLDAYLCDFEYEFSDEKI